MLCTMFWMLLLGEAISSLCGVGQRFLSSIWVAPLSTSVPKGPCGSKSQPAPPAISSFMGVCRFLIESAPLVAHANQANIPLDLPTQF